MKDSNLMFAEGHVFSKQEKNDFNASMKEEAILLLKAGFFLIPLHSQQNGICTCGNQKCSSPGKHPLTAHGSKDATNDFNKINTFWNHYSLANIGIATGQDMGVIVLDIDIKTGGMDSFVKIEQHCGSLAAYRRVQTGGGGFHIYFLPPANIKLKNKTAIFPGIDFRGEGGYVVAPPSIHISGKKYVWLDNHPLQTMPEKLLQILQEKNFPQKEEKSLSINLEQQTILKKEGFPEGSRKTTILSVGGFLKYKGIKDQILSDLLFAINEKACQPPLPQEEVKDVLKSLSKYANQSWKPIIPLPATEEKKVLSLKEEHLPLPLRRWIKDVCYRMQVPIEFIAAPAIIAISSMIGRKIAIKPMKKDKWQVIPNLWGFLVAKPGSMKSAAMSEALKPLEELEKRARTEFEKDCQEEAIKQKDLAFEIEAMKQSMKLDWSKGMKAKVEDKKENLKELVRQESESGLKEKRYLTNDPTIEKLALILKDNPQGVMLFRDELSGWLESLSKSGREGSRQFYLETWGGNGSFSIDRVGRGSTFTRYMCLSIFGSIQPGPLKKYMDQYESSYGQDGFLERFQIAVYPDLNEKRKIIDEYPDEEAYQEILDLFDAIDLIKMDENNQKIAEFTEDAQEIFYQWLAELEDKIASPDMDEVKKSHLSKYRSMLVSLALIFEVVKQKKFVSFVGSDSLILAIEWAKVLESHSQKILNIADYPSGSTKKIILEKIKKGEIYDGITLREIYRKNWKHLDAPEKVILPLKELEVHNYLKIYKSSTSGRSSESILINPSFFEGAA